MTTYAKRYPTTLTEDEDAIAREGYGRNARPILLTDTSINGLLKADAPENCCAQLRASVWDIFAKGLRTIKP